MAGFPALSHIAVTVSDLDRSKEFYGSLFGSDPVLDEDAGSFYHVVYALEGGTLFGLHTHPAPNDQPDFSEFRSGLDHVAFGVPSRADLEKWEGRLNELGVRNGGIVDRALRLGPLFPGPRQHRAGVLRPTLLGDGRRNLPPAGRRNGSRAANSRTMRRLAFVFCAAALVAGLIPGAARAQLPTKEPADYVDPMIGTLAGGFSFPGPAAPYGMVQLSPDTEGEFAYTGYQYGDTSIRGFSHHHIQSMGVHSNGDLPFMPTVGPVLDDDPRSWMSPFDHATEEAQAGYYRVLLERYGILAELTAGERVGMHRYTFPPSPRSNVILDIAHSASGWHPLPGEETHPNSPLPGPETHDASLRAVGDDMVLGSAPTQGYEIHFAAQFSRSFASFTTLGSGGYATFDTTGNQQVLVKVGISFVSRANALENLQAEKPDWDFDALRAKTRAAWNSALETIEVSGGTDAEKTSFYTALYHAQHHPNIYQDVNGEYMGHDDQVHVANDHVHYANFSLWDTYRGENQLLATIDPHRYRDMMLSLLDIYNEGGRFPQWAMNDAYPDYMEGDPIQPTIVDGYCRGILDDSYVDEMYAALRSQAWDEGGKRSATESGYQEYHQRGYMSGKGSDGSGNFEYAIADFSLALMADSLGKTADRDELLTRADNYRELINPDTGFAHPRNADGTWMSGYDPMAPDNWKEGTGWQYTWLAPQDLRGLFDLVGGNGRGGDPYVTERLDTYFSTAAADNPAVAEMQKTITAFGVAIRRQPARPEQRARRPRALSLRLHRTAVEDAEDHARLPSCCSVPLPTDCRATTTSVRCPRGSCGVRSVSIRCREAPPSTRWAARCSSER